MLKYNWEKGRYEMVNDKHPDLLADKLDDWHDDYYDEPVDDDYYA